MTDKMSQQNGDNFEAFMFDLLKNKGSADYIMTKVTKVTSQVKKSKI